MNPIGQTIPVIYLHLEGSSEQNMLRTAASQDQSQKPQQQE